MDSQDDTQDTAQRADEPLAKRAYRRPELVELGDVRELTRGGGKTKKDGNITRRI